MSEDCGMSCGAFVLLSHTRNLKRRSKIATNDDSEHAKAPRQDPSDLVIPNSGRACDTLAQDAQNNPADGQRRQTRARAH